MSLPRRADIAVKDPAQNPMVKAMRNAGPFARAGRAAIRVAGGRRLRACPPAPQTGGILAASPDRLCHQLYERIPRMARHHRAVADLSGMLARRISSYVGAMQGH